MERQFSVADAYSLAPLRLDGVQPFELGGRVYDVPPLTLERFLQLFSFDLREVLTALTDDPGGQAISALAELACVVVPTLAREEWQAHATAWHVCTLVGLIGRNHDWSYLDEVIGFFDEPDGPQAALEDALLRFARVYPGSAANVPAFLAMRVEGFYRTMQRATALMEAQQDDSGDGDGDIANAIRPARDPDRFAEVSALMFAAEERAKEMTKEPTE